MPPLTAFFGMDSSRSLQTAILKHFASTRTQSSTRSLQIPLRSWPSIYSEIRHPLWNYDPDLAGLNARMSEFHAALAVRGLPGLDARIDRRNQIRLRYERRLDAI